MDSNELLMLGAEYAEQYAKYEELLRGLKQLRETPDALPRSLVIHESAPEVFQYSFVGRQFVVHHESDVPKTALWSKIIVSQELMSNGHAEWTTKGFLRIDKGGNIKPDAAMNAQHNSAEPRGVLLLLIELGLSEATKAAGHGH
jgi:hypothetical protein